LDRVRYTIGRLLQMVPIVLGITIVTFLLVHLIPGDPAVVILGIKATPESLAAMRTRMGLDRPLWVQFGIFVSNLGHGNLGDSLVYRVPVMELIQRRLPLTLSIAGYAAVMAVVMAIPLSLIAALRRNGVIDQAIRAVFVSLMSIPGFWIGLMLLILLGIKIPLFPIGGVGETFPERLHHLFLPALTEALPLSAVLTRNLRDAIITTMTSEHVVFARAKGLAEKLVLTRHILRNSMVSSLTVLGVYMSWLVGGSVVIETVFALPGVGSTMIQALLGRDYPVVQGLTLTFGVLVSLVYLITDIAYSFLDPRVAL
jgi:peptide/nickel transport system permease protein